MNFIKKLMIFSFALLLVSTNIECMHQGQQGNGQGGAAPQGPQQGGPKKSSKLLKRIKAIDYWNLGDYLTQLASIYCIDNTDELTVKGLAGARTIFNGKSVIDSLDELLAIGAIQRKDLATVASVCFRSKNVIKDVSNWKNAADLASVNAGRRNDKNLNNKKICQYAWLTVNKLAPYVEAYVRTVENYSPDLVNPHRIFNILFNKIVLEVSELYRQKLMYEMIQNKKKK